MKEPTEAKAVGDIVFSDGSAVAYSEDLTLTSAQQAAAVAIIFDATNNKAVGLVQNGGINWCTADARVYYEPDFAKTLAAESSDTDGSLNNYSITDSMDYYPALNWISSYSTAASLTSYTSGWYLPAKGELTTLINNITTVNAAFNKLGVAELSGNYWSSTIDSEGMGAYYSGGDTVANWTSSFNVCAVRKFN